MGQVCGGSAALGPAPETVQAEVQRPPETPPETVGMASQGPAMIVTRREIRRMSREDQDRWAACVKHMMQNAGGAPESSEFFRIAGYHGWPNNNCEHAQESFPGWHRAYLCEFESALKAADRALGNDGRIGMPYWDWMVEEVNGERYPQVLSRHFREMPADLVSTENELKSRGYGALSSEASILSRLRSSRISDQVYRAFGNEEHFMAASKRWTGDSLESPHDAVHVAAGFPMISVEFAAFHPLFWLHHCNVDRVYEKYIQSEPDSQREMQSNQQRLVRRFGEPNRFASSYAPFKHPVTGDDFMPRDAFDINSLAYTYEDLPPDRQLSMRFPSLAVFYPIKPVPATYMLHVFVVKTEDASAWKSPTAADFENGAVESIAGYAGWGAAWGSKEVETCANCKRRLPYSVRVDVSLALSKLGLKPSQASLKVVCLDAQFTMVEQPEGIPAPKLCGPFFEERGEGAPHLKLGGDGGDVKAVQEYLIFYGYLKGPADGKFGKSTKDAVVAFQKRFNCPEKDGVVRPSLKALMTRPRNDDSSDSGADKALYGKSPKIKVLVDACPGYLDQEAVNDEVRRACSEWQAASSVSFEMLPSESTAAPDLLITWAEHTEGNLFFFDGKGGKLAHAEKEVITLDAAEYWVLQGAGRDPRKAHSVELLPIVLHELGHSLGLGHSAAGCTEDVMWAYYVPGRLSLSQGDKKRIAKLYPPPRSSMR